MFAASQYELLDFGAGRKLERFGAHLLDRPAPAAANIKPAYPDLWTGSTARFERTGQPSLSSPQRGQWITAHALPSAWTIEHDQLQFELKLTDFGHVGLFPEQAANWNWIANQVSSALSQTNQPLSVLNLFAYTGGSTLAVAAAGAEVIHVDSARNTVAWARRNAELSGLSAAPIRWIVDDALKFTRRELKRGRKYDAVILDPPAYGHGSGGETWKLDDQLPELLSICRELTGPQPRFVLLTCHAPDYGPQRLAESLIAAGFVQPIQQVETGNLWLSMSDGRQLHAGMFARMAPTKS